MRQEWLTDGANIVFAQIQISWKDFSVFSAFQIAKKSTSQILEGLFKAIFSILVTRKENVSKFDNILKGVRLPTTMRCDLLNKFILT